MRCAASRGRLEQERYWWWCLGRVAGHLCPVAAIPPAVEPRCTGWIGVPPRFWRAGHAVEPMRRWGSGLDLASRLARFARSALPQPFVARDILHP